MDASDIVADLLGQESNFRRKKVLERWEEENKELADLFVESCTLASNNQIPFIRVFNKFKDEFKAPPGSYSTVKRFVDERMREEESRRDPSGN